MPATNLKLQRILKDIRANTNEMRQNFEAAATSLIGVDRYQRSQIAPGPRGANVSTAKVIEFKAGRSYTGVDL